MGVAPAYLVDSGSQVWQLKANDDGSYEATTVSGPTGLAGIPLIDQQTGTIYNLVILTTGELDLDPAAATGAVTSIPCTTTGGAVRGICAIGGQISTTLLAPAGELLIYLAAVKATFSDGSSTFYNERYFHVPDPGSGHTQIYYVTIHDPSFVGEAPGVLSLTALCETTAAAAHVGENGYIFMGSWLLAGGAGIGSETSCGGWGVAQADTGDFYIN